jgi:hypothetical protein
MADLLVNLLKLPTFEQDLRVRRAQPFELTPVRRFVETNFSLSWADEISVGSHTSRSQFLSRRSNESWSASRLTSVRAEGSLVRPA